MFADRATSFLDPIGNALAGMVLTLIIGAAKLMAIAICLLVIVLVPTILGLSIARMFGYGHTNSGRRRDGAAGAGPIAERD
jgi:hypothetical protein